MSARDTQPTSFRSEVHRHVSKSVLVLHPGTCLDEKSGHLSDAVHASIVQHETPGKLGVWQESKVCQLCLLRDGEVSEEVLLTCSTSSDCHSFSWRGQWRLAQKCRIRLGRASPPCCRRLVRSSMHGSLQNPPLSNHEVLCS